VNKQPLDILIDHPPATTFVPVVILCELCDPIDVERNDHEVHKGSTKCTTL